MNRLNLDQGLACLGPCDLTLVAKGGKQFQVHRNVLLRASPFFEKLLSSDMKESNEGVIRLPTVTDSQMADILHFIYNGSVQFTSRENAEKLIETADFLLLSNLKTMAGKFLEQHMTTETCISMSYLAEQYSCEELVASTQMFVNSNFTTVTAAKEFLSFPSHEVEKWISSDDIVIDAEENVFEIILRWIDHDKSERSGKFSELFSHVRLSCISRDYLLSHVVTNDLVKENADCLNSVTGALEWLDGPTACDVPRPHPPRTALTVNVVVVADFFRELRPCIYLPTTDEWYLLPVIESPLGLDRMKHYVCATVSCKGKLFFITHNMARSRCYDPDSNRWSRAPWTDRPFPFFSGGALAVKNQICFLVEETDSTALWTYSLDSKSLTSMRNWVERVESFAVALDSYIYVIGGSVGRDSQESLSECARFDTEQTEWQTIAPLNEARRNAFGACKNEKIFIAGGSASPYVWETKFLRTCEVYNMLTNEWQFIASLSPRRGLGSMMLVDETLYVLGGRTSERKFRDKVECYNHESDEWNDKATVPVNGISKFPIKDRESLLSSFKGCSLRVFKGILTNLESIAESD